MAKSSFTLRMPGCDILDIEGCRAKLIDVINDDAFETFVRGAEITRVAASDTSAPRGGDASLSCRADSGGGWSCEGRIGFSW